MPTFFTLPGFARRPAAALAVVASLTLVACGGGGDGGGPDGGSVGPAPSASLEALAGDWVQKGCVRSGGQSFKKMLRARLTSPTTLDYHEGVLSFGSGDCSGASQLVGPSRMGDVSFNRSEANSGLAAHWGAFRTVTGTRFGAIWTLRPANLLCLLGDDIPTSQPTLSAVSASLATVPADNCFAR